MTTDTIHARNSNENSFPTLYNFEATTVEVLNALVYLKQIKVKDQVLHILNYLIK